MSMPHQRLASCVITFWIKDLAVTSIKRMFGSIKAIINLAMAEHGIEGRNPFSSIYMPDEVQEERQPIPLDAH